MIRFSCVVEVKGIWYFLVDLVYVFLGFVYLFFKEFFILMFLDK